MLCLASFILIYNADNDTFNSRLLKKHSIKILCDIGTQLNKGFTLPDHNHLILMSASTLSFQR